MTDAEILHTSACRLLLNFLGVICGN